MELVEVGGLLGEGVQRDAVAFFADAHAGDPGATLRIQLDLLVVQTGPIQPKFQSALIEVKADRDGSWRLCLKADKAVSFCDRVVHTHL